MASAKRAVMLVVVLAVFGIVASVGLPLALNQMNSDTTTTLNTSVGTTDEVNANLETTVDSTVDATSATITLNQTTAGGNSVQKTVNVGSNATYAMDKGDVVVSVSEATTGYAVASYEYARDFGFSGSASALWGILGMMIVLAGFLYAVYLALDGANMT